MKGTKDSWVERGTKSTLFGETTGGNERTCSQNKSDLNVSLL
jgi:hypothetical protein